MKIVDEADVGQFQTLEHRQLIFRLSIPPAVIVHPDRTADLGRASLGP